MGIYIIYPTHEQETIVRAFLEANHISFLEDGEEELPQDVLDGIQRGEEDVKAGRTITLDEFKKRHLS